LAPRSSRFIPGHEKFPCPPAIDPRPDQHLANCYIGNAILAAQSEVQFGCQTTIRNILICDKWVPVTTAWGVLMLRMEEWPPIWGVAANILNMQSRRADKEWSSSLGLGEVLTTAHRKN
jgi:hypothetical protein